MEQGLEVKGSRKEASTLNPLGEKSGVVEGRGFNGERATTTVTWHGYRRGKSFEGWSATGNGPGTRVSQTPRTANPDAPLRRSERTVERGNGDLDLARGTGHRAHGTSPRERSRET